MSKGKRKSDKDAVGPFASLRALRDELGKKSGKASDPVATPARDARLKPPAPPSGGEPARGDGEDEALLFHRMFAGVEPLDRSRHARVPKQAIEPSSAAARTLGGAAERIRAEAESVHEHLRVLVDGQLRFEVGDDGLRVEGRRLDVPLDTVRKLRRGHMPIDARLDLHGMSVAEARAQLELFLRTMRVRGERCVLVIHGKGGHSPNGAGVLRGEIAAWLSQSRTSEHVAAFVTARDDDGGEGAVYVLLRR